MAKADKTAGTSLWQNPGTVCQFLCSNYAVMFHFYVERKVNNLSLAGSDAISTKRM